MPLDIRPYSLVILGSMLLIAGFGTILFYPRSSLSWLATFLTVIGIVSIALGIFFIHEQLDEDKKYVQYFARVLKATVQSLRGPVCCIDCEFYVGEHETSLEYINGEPIVQQTPRFSNGMCIARGRLISNGFCQRRCGYFFSKKED